MRAPLMEPRSQKWSSMYLPKLGWGAVGWGGGAQTCGCEGRAEAPWAGLWGQRCWRRSAQPRAGPCHALSKAGLPSHEGACRRPRAPRTGWSCCCARSWHCQRPPAAGWTLARAAPRPRAWGPPRPPAAYSPGARGATQAVQVGGGGCGRLGLAGSGRAISSCAPGLQPTCAHPRCSRRGCGAVVAQLPLPLGSRLTPRYARYFISSLLVSVLPAPLSPVTWGGKGAGGAAQAAGRARAPVELSTARAPGSPAQEKPRAVAAGAAQRGWRPRRPPQGGPQRRTSSAWPLPSSRMRQYAWLATEKMWGDRGPAPSVVAPSVRY
jgi:hypothetical protein